MRCGDFLTMADQRLHALGGYQAEACLDTRTVTLFHNDPDTGERVVHGTGPSPEGQAIEDSANALLASLAPTLDPVKLAFANTYFVIGFAA